MIYNCNGNVSEILMIGDVNYVVFQFMNDVYVYRQMLFYYVN